MPLPHYDRVIFGKAPLRLVVGQVRFPLLFRFSEKPFLAAFQEGIQPEYPRSAQEHQVAVKFSERGVEPAGETLWRFNDREGVWSVILGEGALTLESRRYTSIEDFSVRFAKLLMAASKYLGVVERSRFGLRFINEIRSPDATNLGDWAQLLNPKFVGYAGAPELVDDGAIERAFQELHWKRTNGTLVIRHGLLAGSTVEARQPDALPFAGPFYLIDLDYFDSSECALDVGATLEQMGAYNQSIFQIFRWAIDGRIYNQLEPR